MRIAGATADQQEKMVEALSHDYRLAALNNADRAMLDYVVKLTREPWAMNSGDVVALRAADFDDRAIHDICAIAAYYAFVNRIADGLGVLLEPID